MRYYVEVVPPGEPGTRHEVSVGSGSLGTGREDIVRLAGGSIAGPGALRLQVLAEGVEVTSRDSAAEFTYRGARARGAVVPWGGEIYLGTTRLFFAAEEGAKQGPRPVLVVAFVFALLFALGGILELTTPGLLGGKIPEAPALVPPQVGCRATSEEGATERAREAEALAVAKQERYPFSRGDGVTAIGLLQEASDCFEIARLSGEQKRILQEQRRWRERVERDLRDLRLRLDLALREENPEKALGAVHAIESMLEAAPVQPTDEYQRWLAGIRQGLARHRGR